jgi:uncharacterized protein YjdB
MIMWDFFITITFANDIEFAKDHYKNKALLSDYALKCADVTGDGKVDILDINKMNLHFNKKINLWSFSPVADSSIPSEFITISTASLSLDIGQTHKLTATLLPENSTDTVSWLSSAPSIVSVDHDGNVVALQDGTATIMATSSS